MKKKNKVKVQRKILKELQLDILNCRDEIKLYHDEVDSSDYELYRYVSGSINALSDVIIIIQEYIDNLDNDEVHLPFDL